MGSFYQEYPVRTRPITGLLAESMKGTERAVEGTALSGQEIVRPHRKIVHPHQKIVRPHPQMKPRACFIDIQIMI